MADGKSQSFRIYAVLAAVALIVIIAFFALSPVRRPRPTINGAPAENATTNLSGGPVNAGAASQSGNTTGDR